MNTAIQAKITAVRAQICHYEQRYGRREGSVRLVAVSKTRPASDLQEAYRAGQQDFGENYLQEALDKQHILSELPLTWHFIGPIQSNKTRDIAERFDWVHSIDRLKIAQRLSQQRPSRLGPLNILLQVNISDEASKSGVSLSGLPALAAQVAALPGLALRGLMAIPAPTTDIAAQRAVFRRLREARDNLLAAGFSDCTELSMGMSTDFEAAIAEGATMIRIGTEIFGPRVPAKNP